jgi:hypothetical protein
MAALGTIRYANLDLDPVVFNDTEAWICVDGKAWDKLNHAEAINYAGLMSKEEFEEAYPGLPPLPVGAFEQKKS